MENNSKLIIIHNIIAPYKVALFNELVKLIPNLEVIFIAEKEKRRDWIVDYTKIKFPYTVLFKGSIDDINNFAIAKKTWFVLEKIKPGKLIICDYSNIFGWISLFWAKINKIQIVFWLVSTIDDRKHFFPKEQIKQYFLKHFQLHLSPGIKTKQYLEYMKVDSSKIQITGYGVENKFYLHKYNKFKNDLFFKENNVQTKNNFLFVGRLSPEKNVISTLSAFNNISNIDNEWGLIILGDGEQKGEIQSYILDHKLEKQIHLVGFVQQNNIVKYYANCKVLVLPSISEPWGLVVNEAMICRLPVLVSNRCGCAPELVKEGVNGFTFDPNDLNKLELLMKEFVSGKHNIDKMGDESYKIVERHSPDKIAKTIANAVNNLNLK